MPSTYRAWFGDLFDAFPDFKLEILDDRRRRARKRRCAGAPRGTFDGTASLRRPRPRTAPAIDLQRLRRAHHPRRQAPPQRRLHERRRDGAPARRPAAAGSTPGARAVTARDQRQDANFGCEWLSLARAGLRLGRHERDRPQAHRRPDRGRAGEVPQPHRRLRRDLQAGARGDAERRPLLLPGQRPLAGLPRARQGQPGLGRRRQRIRRLPQRLRRDVRSATPTPRSAPRSRHGSTRAPTSPPRPTARSPSPPSSRAASACRSGASPTPAPSRRWTPSTSPAAPPAAT